MEKRHIVICGGDGLGTMEVHLVLAGAPLMVAAFRADVHLLQRQHNVAADILAPVHGGNIHIAAVVMRLQRGPAAVVQVQQVELAVRADADLQPCLLRMARRRP